MKLVARLFFVFLGCILFAAPSSAILKGSAPVLTPSSRTVINLNTVDFTYEYAWIDHVMQGSGGISPVPAAYGTPTYFYTSGNQVWNNSILDAAGWPTSSLADGVSFGNHILIPASSNYGASVGHGYVFQWTGYCRLQLTAGTWTTQSHTVTSYMLNGNGDWTGATGNVIATYSGAKQEIGWRILNTGQLGVNFCRNLHIYRQDDQADFIAGKIFRSGWKSLFVSQDPSAVRFLNWHGGVDANPTRFEYRAPTSSSVYGGDYTTISPPYGETTGSGNAYALASVTGTPVAMTHGEIATARLGMSMANSVGSGYTISAINKCATGVAPCNTTGQVVTSGAHPFNIGDAVVFQTSSFSGMKEINYYNAVVTAVQDTTHFSTAIDTTSFTTFTSGSVAPFVTLNVGTRGAFPIMLTDGMTPIGSAGSANFLHATDYRTFYFDKTIYGSRDGSGNPVFGVWKVRGNSDGGTSIFNPTNMGAPLEICTALVNELNAMSPAKPIHMWLNIPAPALFSMDPDYSAGSNYSYNAINTVLVGGNGYTGLSPPAHLFVEYSNETWNYNTPNPSATFTEGSYLQQRGVYRSGLTSSAFGVSNYYTALRSVIMATDINLANGVNPRVHFVLAGQGANGITVGGNNYIRSFGSATFFADPLIATPTNPLITSAAAPYSYHYGWATASYFDPPSNHTASFTGTIAATKLTVSAFTSGSVLSIGDFVVGSGVSLNPNTTIVGSALVNPTACSPNCTGTGTTGTYAVSVSQSVGSEVMTKNQYLGYTQGTRTFTDDSAMFNGTDNSGNNGGCYTNAGGACTGANTAQAITNLTAQITVSTGDSQSIPLYEGEIGAYSAAFAPVSVYTMQYEGGYEVNPTIGASYGGHTITAADSAFIIAWQASSSWSTATQNFLTSYRSNSMTIMPALYLMDSQQWGYCALNNSTTLPDCYSGGVEGGALSTTWTTNGTANQALP